MPRFVVSVSVALVVLLGLVATTGRSTTAQEAFATPGPGEFEIAPGQIGRELAGAILAEPPAAPVYLGLLRFTTAPGSVFIGAAEDPSVGLIFVESGVVTFRLEGPVTITRASGAEEVAAGAEFTLEAGEFFVWPPYMEGEVRNDGQEPAVTLLANLAPEEAAGPLIAGTPIP